VGLGGLLILLLGGAGIWIGASLVDDTGRDLFRSLDRPEDAAAPEARPIPSHGARVRVEVLNAGGVRGMAAAARDHLRNEGFDVVHYGNAGSFGRESSVVLHRGGGMEAARGVAAALGIQEVRSEPDSTLLVDVTVLLGSAWGRDDSEAPSSEDPGAMNRQRGGEG
jgi:hypothetical protein